MKKLRIGVLISGRGSNLQALMDACASPDFPVEIAVVFSNKESAYGLERARQANIPTETLSHKAFPTREAFDQAMHAAIVKYRVEYVCMAGFMRLLSDWFVAEWHNKLINIHPSLLPSFKGLDVQAAAINAGVRWSGCTVHFVRPEMDSGPIIVQAVVPVYSNDTPELLEQRILKAEHQCYPQALKLIAEGRVAITDEVVKISGETVRDVFWVNPDTLPPVQSIPQ